MAVAVVLTQIFYVPNTVRILRTRDVQGYSFFGWSLLFLGIACYIAYFAYKGDPVGVVARRWRGAGEGPARGRLGDFPGCYANQSVNL